MKSLCLTLGLAVMLSACGSVKKSPNKLAETDSVPNQIKILNQTANTASLKMKKNKQADNIIAYFNAKGEVQDQAQAGGFYRKLLGRNKKGQAVVQDFYQDNHSKQTNPVTILDDKQLNNFDSAAMEGRVIWYSPDGKITEFLDYHQGLVQRGGYYNLAGQLVLETEGDNSKDPNALVKTRGFYESGSLLFENKQEKDLSESVFYYENGQKMWHAMSNSDTIHAWSKEGKPVELMDISKEVSQAEQRASELMQKYLSKNNL